MNQLTKRPGREVGFGLFGDEFDNLFEGFFRPVSGEQPARGGALIPAIDITEGEKEYAVSADLPGVDKSGIEVTVHDGVLTISAESKSDEAVKDAGRIIRQERRYGKYLRSFRLGDNVDENSVKANFKDGVLKLVVPKQVEAKPKKVSIDVR